MEAGSASASAPVSYNQEQITQDMPVYAADGAHLGKVKEVRDTGFVVSHGLLSDDFEADYSAIRSVDNGQVYLNFNEDQINQMSK